LGSAMQLYRIYSAKRGFLLILFGRMIGGDSKNPASRHMQYP